MDRPIIFSAPMVRALLEGRKTQTRRLIKPRGRVRLFGGDWSDEYVLDPSNAGWRAMEVRYAPGDRLYVREGWKAEARFDDCPPRRLPKSAPIYYLAGGGGEEAIPECAGRSRPSIHMPRWASRLALTVTDVRVQRLQEISEDDARAEGVSSEWSDFERYGQSEPYRYGFSALWNSLHGPDAWAANPWVVALTFTVERRNIDAEVAK